jgi:hypothetical protein
MHTDSVQGFDAGSIDVRPAVVILGAGGEDVYVGIAGQVFRHPATA